MCQKVKIWKTQTLTALFCLLFFNLCCVRTRLHNSAFLSILNRQCFKDFDGRHKRFLRVYFLSFSSGLGFTVSACRQGRFVKRKENKHFVQSRLIEFFYLLNGSRDYRGITLDAYLIPETHCSSGITP